MSNNHSPLACPVCKKELSPENSPYVNSLYENDTTFDNLKVYRCSQCDLVFSYPFLPSERLAKFYHQIYRSEAGSHAHQLNDFSLFSKYGLRAFSQFQLGRTFWQEKSALLKIIDVGPGCGASLLVAKKLFPKAQLFAVEPDVNCHKHLRKMGATTYGFMFEKKKLSAIKEKFDLLLCSHVLEHYNADELLSVLDGIHHILKKDGVAIFEVPYEGGADDFSRKQNLAPHLSFFTEHSLAYLLEEKFSLLFCNSCGPKRKTDNLSIAKKNKRPHVLFLYKQRIKRSLANAPIPFVKRMIQGIKKMREPEFHKIVGSEQYSYGPDKVLIRAVVALKHGDKGIQTEGEGRL